MSGCEKSTTTEDVSTITYYVTFNLEGASVMKIPLGQNYVDPGFTAMEGENDVTSEVTVQGSVDSEQLGLYTITYSAVNSDGYSSSTERTVIVYSPNAPSDDLSGTYSSNVHRRPPYDRSFNDLTVSITPVTSGIFAVSDLLGGFYDQGSNYGYGSAYRAKGYISLNSDYTISMLSSHIAGWGDSLDDMTDGVYDPNTGIITWTVYYVGAYTFDVTLKK